jgi:alkylation response protein AidB-like acyl-CoA dehydrogenase
MNQVTALTDTLLDTFDSAQPAESAQATAERLRVREFLADAQTDDLFRAECDSWLSGFAPQFSAALGARGWIGMSWPKQYGGRGRPAQVRLAVIEELLVAGAPVAAHWFADRQIGPSLLRVGTDEQRARFLPAMARGELYFCVGMSEPDSGSDLASVRTKARRTDGGWVVQGAKIWTSNAQHCHFMLALVRTGAEGEHASAALSQLIIDMKTPGVTVRPIVTLDGRAHFCEVFLDEVFVPDAMVLGEIGAGWQQVVNELAFERSGPERFLSAFPLLRCFAATAEPDAAVELGELVSRLHVLRTMAACVAAALDRGEAPANAAALVKDIGTRFENEAIDVVQRLRPGRPSADAITEYDRHLAQAVLHAPGFTLRGGTNEILRGILARAIGLR